MIDFTKFPQPGLPANFDEFYQKSRPCERDVLLLTPGEYEVLKRAEQEILSEQARQWQRAVDAVTENKKS